MFWLFASKATDENWVFFEVKDKKSISYNRERMNYNTKNSISESGLVTTGYYWMSKI